MLADSRMGVDFNKQSFNILSNSIIVSQSNNYGNPINCTGDFVACEPISGVWPAGEGYNTLPARPGPGCGSCIFEAVVRGCNLGPCYLLLLL